MTVENLMPSVQQLSVAERLELIERIWDSLPESLEPSDVPDWHIDILKKRLAAAEANPGDGTPLEEFIEELRKTP